MRFWDIGCMMVNGGFIWGYLMASGVICRYYGGGEGGKEVLEMSIN